MDDDMLFNLRQNHQDFYQREIDDSIYTIKRELEKIRRNGNFINDPSTTTRLINSVTLALRRYENQK
jgi:hypothetical protein